MINLKSTTNTISSLLNKRSMSNLQQIKYLPPLQGLFGLTNGRADERF